MPDAPPSPSAPAPLLEAIAALANRRSLTESQTTVVFGAVMRGEATPAQIAALLMGLRVKGETAEGWRAPPARCGARWCAGGRTARTSGVTAGTAGGGAPPLQFLPPPPCWPAGPPRGR